MKKRKNQRGAELKENIGPGYWVEPRWVEVRRLKREGRHQEANTLASKIRFDWGKVGIHHENN